VKMDNNDQQLILQNALESFLSTFSHQIRTPLSVVWNDLQYWKKSLDLNEADRALARCKEITEMLSALTELASNESASTQAKWSELADKHLCSFERSIETERDEPHANNRRRIEQLFSYLDKFLAQICTIKEGAGVSKSRPPCAIKIGASSMKFSVSLGSKTEDRTLRCATELSDFLKIKNSLCAPIIDFICIFESLNAEYWVEDQKVHITIQQSQPR